MRVLYLVVAIAVVVASASAEKYIPRRTGQFDFPVYTNKPLGKQMTGGHAPATTPALAPEESQKQIMLPPGFEARLFAAEPEVVNPVAMTWDDRGRLWVVELYEYPKGAPKGEKGRDRIKILEDTDADGRADKVKVFAEGYSLATGLLLGNGGVYLGQAPDLYFLQDTDGDDKADKKTVLKTGFGMEDRHELLNGFAWGPDGWLYMTHGVFTHSKVRDPNDPDDDGIKMDAALARYHPKTKKFEVFADGTSNPWGVDWNERGDAFVSACVIMHLFHMAPGGQYNRQGGTWANPYGYVADLPTRGLPAIVDWRHFRAAHAGLCAYAGNQYPQEWQGLLFLGNIHQSAINLDRLTPVGATYKAEKESKLLGKSKGDFEVGAGNFLVSKDPWFRPVSTQTGPDGALWIMDWYDRYPCYQNAQADPEGVDREHGRIWRIVHVGDKPGKKLPSRPETKMDLQKLSTAALVKLLEHPNNWQRRQAQRLLSERSDSSAKKPLSTLLASKKPAYARLAALWTLGSAGLLDDTLLDKYASDTTAEVRTWTARFTGEMGKADKPAMNRISRLAEDKESTVRAAAATALRQMVSGSLTVNTAQAKDLPEAEFISVLEKLLDRSSVQGDPLYAHLIWMAAEPRLARNPQAYLRILERGEESTRAALARRAMRRICDLSDAKAREEALNAAMQFLANSASRTQVASAALDGLIEAQKSKGAPPTIKLEPVFAKLTANPALAEKARRLATLLGDTSASRGLIAKINDTGAGVEERSKAIQAGREAKTDAARAELLLLLRNESNPRLQTEAVRALNEFPGDQIAYDMLDSWKKLANPVRRVAGEVLVTRSKWARALLAGVDKKIVAPEDISATARRSLARAEDATIRDHADRVLGRYRATGEDKLRLIAEKRKVVLAAEPDMKVGYEVAKRTCYVCHKLHGEGADVGPDLTGVGRSTLDALLHNVIDPNEVVGHGYENTEVELKDGRTVSGRIVEDTDTRLKLVASGPIEQVVAKSDIAFENSKPKIRTSELSLMPEGLEQMPDADFRNMIWYILNPPQDNRPMTRALRKELVGDEAPQKSSATEHVVDGESVALWNPDWHVICPPFEGAPAKLTEYAGRRNVLMTHPANRTAGASLERFVQVPAKGRPALILHAAAHEKGDWELRVLADGKLLHRQIIDAKGERWKRVEVDLSSLAGKEVRLRLENAANDWSWEFGYWSDLEIKLAQN